MSKSTKRRITERMAVLVMGLFKRGYSKLALKVLQLSARLEMNL